MMSKVIDPEAAFTVFDVGVTFNIGVTPDCATVTTWEVTPVPDIVILADLVSNTGILSIVNC